MNYVSSQAVPYNFSNQAYFYVNTPLGASIGVFEKSMQGKSLITIDYTALSAVTLGLKITGLSFILNKQTTIPLVISQPMLVGQQNILQFMLSGGFGGVQYSVNINTTWSDLSIRSDLLLINIIPPYEDDCCDKCGYHECHCMDMGCCDNAIVDLKDQVAVLATNDSIYGTNFTQYYVSNIAPQNPNLFDKWMNPTTGVISDFVSNGLINYWQPEFSGAGGVIGGPVTINNSFTVNGPVDLTLDMGIYA